MADSLHVPVPVIEKIITAVWEHAEISHRWYALKAGLLGLPILEAWDIFAPPGEPGHPFSWEEARDIACSALGTISPKLEKDGALFFEHPWIDGEIRKGKRGGAFTHPGSGTAHPFVLLNFSGSPGDVVTLTHELCHGIHYYRSRLQEYQAQQPPPVVMEMFAALGEYYVLKELTARYPGEERALTVTLLETLILKVFRQASLFRWELDTWKDCASRRHLDDSSFSEMWLTMQKELYGEGVRLGRFYGEFWVTISHFFHFPLYGLNYVLGTLAALGMVELLDQGHPRLPKGILALIESGSAVDLTGWTGTWLPGSSLVSLVQGGLNVIEGLVTDVENRQQRS